MSPCAAQINYFINTSASVIKEKRKKGGREKEEKRKTRKPVPPTALTVCDNNESLHLRISCPRGTDKHRAANLQNGRIWILSQPIFTQAGVCFRKLRLNVRRFSRATLTKMY